MSSTAKRSGLLGLVCTALTMGCGVTPSPLSPTFGGSVGWPHRGVLTGGQRLPQKGKGFVRLRSDRIRWGNPRMVSAVQRAAAEVARQRPGAASVVIADLSAKRGGKIQRHRSHRTGRDIDLLFYVTTAEGWSVENPGFIHFGPDGLARRHKKSGPFYQLDIPRQWLLIKSLLLSPQAQVQYMFVARWLEALIIEYAHARGEDLALIYHAQKVLHQPSDSACHDDHIHLRIACTPAEEVAGCRGGGPRWSWLPPSLELVEPSDEELLHALLDDD